MMFDTSFIKKAEMYALIAAILNGLIGVFTRLAFEFDDELSPSALAFFKCFFAFLLVAVVCVIQPKRINKVALLAKQWYKFALLSFLGIFCLYFFETWAFSKASIPLVSFLTYASGVVTLLLAVLFLNEKITSHKMIAFASIISGVCLLFLFEQGVSGSIWGMVLALLGGLGYSLFIFLSKVLSIGSGLAQLFWLFAFGSVYLFLPWYAQGMQLPSGMAWLMIAYLVLLPTIGGFYFTTKAVQYGQASKVQIIETSDPMFATLFAFVVFGDTLGWFGYLGTGFILFGLLLSVKK